MSVTGLILGTGTADYTPPPANASDNQFGNIAEFILMKTLTDPQENPDESQAPRHSDYLVPVSARFESGRPCDF